MGKGRIWLIGGTALGIALALGAVPYFAGAARSLAGDAQRLVGSGGSDVIRAIGKGGAPARAVGGLAAVFGVILPGLTALLLVVAAKGARRLRILAALVLVALGATAFLYQPAGAAIGALVLAAVAALVAYALTGPLLMLPLCALAGLIGAETLPRIITDHHGVPGSAVPEIHHAVFATAGSPMWLAVIVLVVAALPFVAAARLVVRS